MSNKSYSMLKLSKDNTKAQINGNNEHQLIRTHGTMGPAFPSATHPGTPGTST